MPSPDLNPPKPLFPKLSGRSAAMDAEQVARHQRGRLMGAMVEAVARDGYERVTVAKLVALAGISKSAFYAHFTDKEECFLATFDEIVERGTQQIGTAFRSQGDFRERLESAFEKMVEICVEQSAAAHLVLVDALSLGAASIPARERSTARYEAMIGQSLAAMPLAGEVSELGIRAIVGGIREIIYRCLREGEPARLGGQIAELVDWATAYGLATAAGTGAGVGARLVEAAKGGEAAADPADPQEETPSWEEPANSPRSRSALSQRERIIRATAQVAVKKGYAALSIPAISAAAGTSNQTFYQQFASKEEAFLAAFDALAMRAFEMTAAAFAADGGWMEAGARAISTLLEYFAGDRLFRQLVFIELHAAGPAALDRAEGMLGMFMAFLQPDPLPPEVATRPPQVVIEAISGGIWAVVQHEVVAGRGESLPDLVPQILDFVLLPFGVE